MNRMYLVFLVVSSLSVFGGHDPNMFITGPANIETTNEPNHWWEDTRTSTSFEFDPNTLIDWTIHAWEPVSNIHLTISGVQDPFIFEIDGVGKEFTHQEFKEKLGFVKPPTTIQWVPDFLLFDCEIGLRSDGIIVWKERRNE